MSEQASEQASEEVKYQPVSESMCLTCRDSPPEFVPSPSMSTVAVLKGLAMVLSYLLRHGQGYADDYRSALWDITMGCQFTEIY